MSAPIDKLPKAERIEMIDARIRNIESGAGDWPNNTRHHEINRLFDVRAAIMSEPDK